FGCWQERRIGSLARVNQLPGVDEEAQRVDVLDLKLPRQIGIRAWRTIGLDDAPGKKVPDTAVLWLICSIDIVEGAVLTDDNDYVFNWCCGVLTIAVVVGCKARRRNGVQR